jgi:hypothetical protein
MTVGSNRTFDRGNRAGPRSRRAVQLHRRGIFLCKATPNYGTRPSIEPSEGDSATSCTSDLPVVSEQDGMMVAADRFIVSPLCGCPTTSGALFCPWTVEGPQAILELRRAHQLRPATMSDREDRRGKIASVFAPAAGKAQAELRREIEKSDIHLDADGAVFTVWVKGQGRLHIRFSVGNDNSVWLSTNTKPTGGIGNLYDEGIENAVAKAIVNELRRKSR